MSTKTLRKRIALVAVSALGAGLLSIAPANATVSTTGSVGLAGPVSGSVATAETATLLNTGSLVLASLGGARVAVSAGAAITSSNDLTNISGSQACSDSAGTTQTTVTIKPTGAVGSTFTVSLYSGGTCAAGLSTLTEQVTVTISSSSLAGTPSAANSTLNWYDGAGGLQNAGQDDANSSSTTRGTPLYLLLVLKDVYNTAITTAGALTATVSSGATVSLTAHATTASGAGTYSTAVLGSALATGGKAIVEIDEATAGTGWAGTVTVSYNGTHIATRSGTITGDITKITPSAVAVANAAGGNSADTIEYQAYDAAGNIVALTTPASKLLLSSSSAPAIANTITADNSYINSTTAAGQVGVTCSSAGKTDIVLYYVNAAGTIVKSSSVTVNCGGAADSYKAAFDKKAYTQGDVATLTVSFIDSKGNPANSSSAVSATPTADQVLTAPQMKLVTEAGGYKAAKKVGADGTVKYVFTVGTDSGVVDGNYNAVVSFPTVNAVNGANQAVAYSVSSGASASVTNAQVLAAIVKLIASINKQIAALQKSLTAKKK